MSVGFRSAKARAFAEQKPTFAPNGTTDFQSIVQGERQKKN